MPTPALPNSIRQTVRQLRSFSVDLLREMVATPSVTGSEHDAQLKLARHLRELGLSLDMWSPSREEVRHHPAFCDDGLPLGDRPVIVARWPGTSPATGRSLILNGHMDVVPAGDETAWNGGPWSGHVQDDRLWGRGACDMKGGIVAAVTAIAALQRMGIQLQGDVFLESVIGEESGGVGTLATIVRGYRADAALLLEPTSMDMCPIGAGALSFRLHVHGRSAHGAMRAEGVSAVSKFFLLEQAIERLECDRHATFEHALFPHGQLAAPISIGRVQAGDWPSTVPESLIAEGRYGVLPGEDVTAARLLLEAAIRTACEQDGWLREHPADVEWFEGQFEPGETPEGAPILQTVHEAHAMVCDRSPSIHGVPYGSDLRLFTRHAGMHAVLYGPGDIRVAHSLNEYVPLQEVAKTAEVVALALVNWCGAA